MTHLSAEQWAQMEREIKQAQREIARESKYAPAKNVWIADSELKTDAEKAVDSAMAEYTFIPAEESVEPRHFGKVLLGAGLAMFLILAALAYYGVIWTGK